MYRFESRMASIRVSSKEHFVFVRNQMTGEKLTARRVQRNKWKVGELELKASSEFTVIEVLLKELGLPTMTALRHYKTTEEEGRNGDV